MIYQVTVREETSKTFEVEADSPDEAKETFEAGSEGDFRQVASSCHFYGVEVIQEVK
jgi:hypothetical protein